MADLSKFPKFVEKAIIDTFRIQFKSQATIKKITMEAATIAERRLTFDCMSMVSLQSSSLVGQLGIALPRQTCLGILERFLGEKVTELTVDNSDAFGELLNIIFSSSRKLINESGFDFQLAIPSTVIGRDISVTKTWLQGYVLFFDCSSDIGDFLVMLTLRQASAAKAS